MNTYPPVLLAHLSQEITSVCHCWKLTRSDGVVLGFTDHNAALTVDGILYEPSSGFSASEARETLGLAASTVDVEGALSSDLLREEEIAAGLYDGASVDTLLVNWRKPEDFAAIRKATIGRVTLSDNRLVAELQGAFQVLDQPAGRCVRRLCDAELGDGRCGVALATSAFRGSGAVVATAGAELIEVSGLGGGDVYAMAGHGLCAGRGRYVPGDGGLRQEFCHLQGQVRQRRELPRLSAPAGQ